MIRSAAVLVALAVSLGAADPAAWITAAGGAAERDRGGEIVSVDLRASWVTDGDLAELAALPHLARLDLSLTRTGDHGLRQLRNATGIADLNLYYAELITDAGLAAVKDWKHLKRLNVRGTKVTDAALRALAGVASLESLDIGYAQITDAGLEPLASLPNLKELVLGGNKLTDAGLQVLREMPGLTVLDLVGTQRTDSGLWSVSLTQPGVEAIATLKALRVLRLSGTLVSGPMLARLSGLAHLERLDLGKCPRIGDDAAPVIASFPALRRVDLFGTAMTGKGIAVLRRAKPECSILEGTAEQETPVAMEP